MSLLVIARPAAEADLAEAKTPVRLLFQPD